MATHDYVIANQSGGSFRADLNNALAAIVSNNSNATEPATTYAYMWWADTTTGQLKLRNAANDAWITIQELDGTMLMEAGSAASPGLAFATDLDTGLYLAGANSLGLSTGGTARAVIDSSGNFGINTASPSSQLTVGGNPPTAGAISAVGASGGIALALSDNVNSSLYVRNASGGSVIGTDAGGNIRFATNGNGTADEKVRIDSSGRVGIGTSSPARGPLHVHFAGSSDCQIHLTNNDTGSTSSDGLTLFSNVGGAGLWYRENSDFVIATNNAEKVRIDSSGNVGIGTSSAGNKLSVVGYGNATSGWSVGSEDGNTSGYFVSTGSSSNSVEIAADPNNAGANSVMGFSVDGSERVRIDSNGILNTRKAIGSTFYSDTGTDLRVFSNTSGDSGSVSIESSCSSTSTRVHITLSNPNGVVGSIRTSGTSTSYNTSSDYRLKENVTLMADGIARLQQLKPSRFNFIADPDTVVDGFIAHEVQTIVPEAITGEKDAVNENGDPEYQGIDQSKLVPLLTAALQEAIGEIESLKARVAALEGN